MKNNQPTQTEIPQGPTKNCKHCKSIIPKGAKICPICHKKQRGIGKWILIVIIVLIIFAAIGGSGDNTTPTVTPDTTQQATNEEPQQTSDSEKDTSISTEISDTTSSDSVDTESGNAETTESTNSADISTGINEEKFDSIQNGMTYDEVIEIIGSEGTSVSESEVAGIKTAIYQWDSSDGWGSATVTFQDGKVINKAQMGVSSGDDVKITLEQYNAIETGMSYDDVVSLIGGEGSLLSDSEIAGSTAQIYMWEGSSLGANANVTFSDGKVISKAQFGLE